MATTYTTRDGDTVDRICWRFYGRERETTELVYRENPDLAEFGPVLPPNLRIRLPDFAPEPQRTIRIWG